jgi:hypothetical protein
MNSGETNRNNHVRFKLVRHDDSENLSGEIEIQPNNFQRILDSPANISIPQRQIANVRFALDDAFRATFPKTRFEIVAVPHLSRAGVISATYRLQK